MSQEVTASLQQLYETLAAGSLVRMEFAGSAEAETFRLKFIKYKASQERMLIDIGVMEKEQFKAFSFIRKREWIYELKFRDKQPVKTYTFVIMDTETQDTATNASS